MNEQGTKITFHDNYIPTLPAGEYELTMEQRLVEHGGSGRIPSKMSAPAQRFIVKAPRFKLSQNDVHRRFPAEHATGVFHEYIPSVVFNKRAMPWERGLQTAETYPAPWMNLLVFTPDQLIDPASDNGAGANLVQTKSMTLSELLSSGPTVRAPHFYKRGEGNKSSGAPLEDNEDPDKIRVDVIEMSAKVFKSLVPNLKTSAYLSHVREVAGGEKDHRLMVHDGWHSVMMANRFAVPPKPSAVNQRQTVNIAHVVSVEGFEDLLNYPDGGEPSLAAEVKTVRMISLFSWSFNCVQDPKENFSKMMTNLISAESRKGTSLLYRVPIPEQAFPAEDHTYYRFLYGYIPMVYKHRNKKDSFAWYRGPFSPVAIKNRFEQTGLGDEENQMVPKSAAEAMIFDGWTGSFDQSYAAAWEIGRMLALNSKPFATNLFQWRREAHALVDLLLERIKTYRTVDGAGNNLLDAKQSLTPNGMADLQKLLDQRLVSDKFNDYLAGDFAQHVADSIGKQGGFTDSETYQYQGEASLLSAKATTDSDKKHLDNLLKEADVVDLLNDLSGLTKNKDGKYESTLMSTQIIEWLAQLMLLHKVPFNYLVPDEKLLPNESIRFFYMDRNWVEALLDGALSIAIHSSRDSLFHKLTRDKLHRAVEKVVHQVRGRFSGLKQAELDGPNEEGTQMAGFLLRSTAVSSWPGLEIDAWYSNAKKQPVQMKPLRLEKLSDHILLCIFPQIPVRVDINEPAEGLVFGTEDDGITVRALSGEHKGKTLYDIKDPNHSSENNYRVNRSDIPIKTDGVIQILGADGLKQKLESHLNGAVLSPAELAVQLVRVPEQMRFEFPGVKKV